MSDPTFNSVTVRQPTAGASADLLTLDSVDGADGNGAALRFVNNSAGPLNLALGRISIARVDPSTVRLDLAVAADPSLSSGDTTPALLSLLKGAGPPSITTAAGSTLAAGGTLSVSGAASFSSGLSITGALAVVGDTALSGGLSVSGAASFGSGLHISADMSVSGSINGRDVSADGARLDTHLANNANPHGTTAAQVGALALTGGALTGELRVQGALFAGGSDLYFTERTHAHTGVGNASGFAAIENAANYDALMILGRAGTPQGRAVKLWDYLQINGNMDTTGNLGVGTSIIHNPQGWNKVLDVMGISHARLNVRSHSGVITSVFSHDNWGGARGVIGTESGHPLTFATGYTHRMTIDPHGNVGVGILWPGTKLHVVGNRIRLEEGGKILDMRADGSALDIESSHDLWLNNHGQRTRTRNFWYDSLNRNSSREYKQDIAPYSIDEAAGLLPALTPVTFSYRADPLKLPQIGFIAEEMPDCIATEDRRGIRVDNLLAVLVAVVRQQQQGIAALRAEVAELRGGAAC